MLAWLKMGAFVACLLAAGVAGWRLRDDAAARGIVKAQAAADAFEHRNQAAGASVDQAYVAQASAARANADTIRGTTYVSAADNLRFRLPAGFVRELNDAAAGVPSAGASAGRPDDPAAGVAASVAADSIRDNYLACNAIRDQLIGLQTWERSQQ